MQIPSPQATTMAMPALAAALLGALSPTHAASYKMLHAFQGGADGLYPEGKLTSDGNALYGATDLGGGECNCGTVYRLSERTEPRRSSTLLPAAQPMAPIPRVAWRN